MKPTPSAVADCEGRTPMNTDFTMTMKDMRKGVPWTVEPHILCAPALAGKPSIGG